VSNFIYSCRSVSFPPPAGHGTHHSLSSSASVDLDTDGMIQKTIQTEFSGKTLICIAHRLRTILSYDRILVMDGGEVAVSHF
jgi:hypothetical protein